MKKLGIFAVQTFVLWIGLILFQGGVWAGSSTLGIPDGTYTGGGTLVKDKWLLRWLLRVPFTSVRTFENGELTAHSVGRILLFFKKSVHAHLRFTPMASEPGKYNVYDLEWLDAAGNPKLVGSASPTNLGYVNTSTMMKGSISVVETLIPDSDGKGFRVENALQCDRIFRKMIYKAAFRTE